MERPGSHLAPAWANRLAASDQLNATLYVAFRSQPIRQRRQEDIEFQKVTPLLA